MPGNAKTAALYFAVLIEIIVIVCLVFFLIKRATTSLVNVNPLLGESLVHNPKSNLKYFFEPVPGSISIIDTKWATAKFQRNKDGLNDRYDYSPEKDDTTYRIITLGDSFTAGLGVGVSQNYSELLEDRLNAMQKCGNINKFEVINLGVAGYDIQYSVERFRLRGQKYQPDMVIWLLKHDDFYEINELEMPHMQEIITQMKKSGEWDKLIKQGRQNPQADHIADVMKKIHVQMGETELLGKQMRYVRSIRQYFKGNLVLATFPYNYDLYRKAMIDFSGDDEGVYYFGKLTDLKKNKELTFYPYDEHPNRNGHKALSDDLFNFLEAGQVLPCN